MGVDYDARFGIGFDVKIDIENSKFDCGYEFLEDLTDGEPYRYFEYGESNYGGDCFFCVVLRNPFGDGFDLTGEEYVLKDFLSKNECIEINGRFGCVGGLHVW